MSLSAVLDDAKTIVKENAKLLKNVVVSTDKNNVLTVKRRSLKAAAVQFTGKNGAEIVAFVKEYASEPSISVRNGGSYVTISFPNQGGRVRKGDWVVVDADGSVVVADQDRFELLFAVKG